ncbi:MAG TPA: sugar ABC transporter substrate-binding protein [Candidatus Methylomirabilis sp.]|nr:sugar ABC transporter substrate-binding protein [Candidatus Methylomirabilis sp.]
MLTRRHFLRTAAAGICAAQQMSWPMRSWAQKRKYQIVVHTKNVVAPFWKVCQTGARLSADRWKNEVELFYAAPTKPDNIEEQTRIMEDWITKKPDAMVFVPVDYVAMVPTVQKAVDAGIPIVNYCNRMAAGKVEIFVGSDDEQLAYEIARYVFNAVGNKGKVIVLDGVPGAITAQDRHRGFMRAIRDTKGMELLAAQPANYSRLQGVQVMENLLQRFPTIDVTLSADDEMGLGAIEAIDAAGRLGKIKVTGVNATQVAVQSVLQGRLFATPDYSGFDQGYLATEAAYRLLKGEKLPQQILLPVVIVDKTNAQAYNIQPDQRKPPSWDKVLAAQR